MKLTISLNASGALDTKEGFAGMLRHIADTIEGETIPVIDTALYDSGMMRVGHLLFNSGAKPTEKTNEPFRPH